MRTAHRLLLILAVLAFAGAAIAQPAAPGEEPSSEASEPAQQPPAAEDAGQAEDAGALFDRGLGAMMEERYDEGCPLLARSFAIEPLAGAEFTLAECYAKWGKTASALEHYKGYLLKVGSMSDEERRKQGPRVSVAEEQVPALEKIVPSVQLSLPPNAPSGTEVELDGVRVLYLGTRQKVDPGEHRAVVKLPSGETADKTFTIAPEENAEVLLPVPEGTGEPIDEGGGGMDGDTMRLAGLIVGGVGVATVAVSMILGGVALGKKGTIEDNCNDYICNREGKDAADSAQGLATGSTVTFIIGLVAVAAGVTVYLLAPDDAPAEGEGDGDGDGGDDGFEAEMVVGGLAGDPLSATLGMKLSW